MTLDTIRILSRLHASHKDGKPVPRAVLEKELSDIVGGENCKLTELVETLGLVHDVGGQNYTITHYVNDSEAHQERINQRVERLLEEERLRKSGIKQSEGTPNPEPNPKLSPEPKQELELIAQNSGESNYDFAVIANNPECRVWYKRAYENAKDFFKDIYIC